MGVVTYSAIFAILIGSTVFELILIGQPLSQQVLITSIIGLAGVKAVLVALFFQHLKDEPKAISSIVLFGFTAVILLITLSLLSIAALHGV
ncbi:MAG: cytochrome C oxidase subunit IV family protein [Thaumarchaeota archaeon]|nr:cytochrome C oxidase subunit IV family protein [Nitrososphaerota archaeon]